MALNDSTTPLTLLATRRSGKPRDLIAPGPDAATLARIIEIAARTPDHGKLFPWRFVIVADAARETFAQRLGEIVRAEKADYTERDIDAAHGFARQAPALVVVLSSPIPGHKVPVWEQELSAGAACMNLLHAVHAHGFAGGWLTGWAAYSDAVLALFGSTGEQIAGFVFIGTPAFPLEERPRPDPGRVVSVWAG